MSRVLVTPGDTRVEVLSAMPGGKAEEVLRQIAKPQGARIPSYTLRNFGEWSGVDGGGEECSGTVTYGEDIFPVTLKLGVQVGLFLKDVPGTSTTLKDWTPGVLNVGQDIQPEKVGDLANQIIGTHVVHGKNWFNRKADLCLEPYGSDHNRQSVPVFQITDGSLEQITVGQLIEKGARRSTHAGQWTRPYAVVPAALGMPILIHEFRVGSDDVAVFETEEISGSPRDIWGPYCTWKILSKGTAFGPDNGVAPSFDPVKAGQTGRDLVHPDLVDLAYQSRTPYHFHVHATMRRFPNCKLASSFLIEKLGGERIRDILKKIAESQPDRFYKLIDENGRAHRLVSGGKATLRFENGFTIAATNAVENVMTSFAQMVRLEQDPGFDLPRIPRVILDPHFYLVVFAMAEGNGHAHHLSGSEMHRYLFKDPSTVKMHRARNDRLFRLLAEDGATMHCVVYPPLEYNPTVHQYNFDPQLFDKDDWASRVVA